MESNANQFPKPRLQSEVGCTSPASVHSGRLKAVSEDDALNQMHPPSMNHLSVGAQDPAQDGNFLSPLTKSSAESTTDSFIDVSDPGDHPYFANNARSLHSEDNVAEDNGEGPGLEFLHHIYDGDQGVTANGAAKNNVPESMDQESHGLDLAMRLMSREDDNRSSQPRLAGDCETDEVYPDVPPTGDHLTAMIASSFGSQAQGQLNAIRHYDNHSDSVHHGNGSTVAASPHQHAICNPQDLLLNQNSQAAQLNPGTQPSSNYTIADTREQRAVAEGGQQHEEDGDTGDRYDVPRKTEGSLSALARAASRKRPAEAQLPQPPSTSRVRMEQASLQPAGGEHEQMCEDIFKELKTYMNKTLACWKPPNGMPIQDLKTRICSQSEAVDVCQNSEDWRENFLARVCTQIKALASLSESSYLDIVERLFDKPAASRAAVMLRSASNLDLTSPAGSSSDSAALPEIGVTGRPIAATMITIICPPGRLQGHLRWLSTLNCDGAGGQDADISSFQFICLHDRCRHDQSKKATFRVKYSWLRHVEMRDPSKLWYCQDHDEFFTRKEHINNHFAVKHGDMNKKDAHILISKSQVYDGEKLRICPWCSQTFMSWTGFYSEHIAKKHADEMRKASIDMRRRQFNRDEPGTGGGRDGPNDGAAGGDVGSSKPHDGGYNGGGPNGGEPNGGTSNGGESYHLGATGSYLKVNKPREGGCYDDCCKIGGHQDSKAQLLNASLPPWVPNFFWISPWLKLILDGGSVSDRAAIKKTWMTTSAHKLWCFVGATDPMMESALVLCRDALDTGTALFSDIGAWFSEIPECNAEVDDDDFKSLSEDCELAASIEASNANEAPPDDRRRYFLRKRRTFTADMSSAESDTCEELRSTDWSHLDKSFDMYGGEIHNRSPVRPGSWHPWDNKHQPDWESRMGYSAAQQRADQAKVEMSCITHGLVDLSLSTSSDSTTDSEATKATVYDSEDGKFFLQLEQRPAEADILNSTNRVHDIGAVSYDGDDDREAAPVAVLSTIHETEISA